MLRPQLQSKEIRDRDSPEMGGAEEVAEVAGWVEKTEQSMEERLVVNSLNKKQTSLLLNCREMQQLSFLDTNTSLKIVVNCLNARDSNKEDYQSPSLPTLPLGPTTILTMVTMNVPFARMRSCAIPRSGLARLAGLFSI